MFNMGNLWGFKYQYALVVIIALVAALSFTAAIQKSVTIDEFQSIPYGLNILKTGEFNATMGTTPISYVLPALPLLFTEAKIHTPPGKTNSWSLGYHFSQLNSHDYHTYFMLGRSVSLVFFLATIIFVFFHARNLYGLCAAFFASVITAFVPNMIAHGLLITPDIYLSFGIVASLYFYDCFLQKVSIINITFLGFFIAFAVLSKLTGLLLFGLFPLILALQVAWSQYDYSALKIETKHWLGLLAALFVGIAFINLAYASDLRYSLLGDLPFNAPLFQALQNYLPSWLAFPLPDQFVLEIDSQLHDSGYSTYFLGKLEKKTFPSYYIVAMLVKYPLPLLILTVLSFLIKKPTQREIPVIFTVIFALAFFSFSGHKNIGIRYILFAEPLLAIWISRIAFSGKSHFKNKWRYSILTVGSSWILFIALFTWPNYLSYFNFVAGGPLNGHKYLLDSNLDWGQDLPELKKYMNERKIKAINLAYFGRARPELYGISYGHLIPGQKPLHRYSVVSSHLLWGGSYYVNSSNFYSKSNTYIYFRKLKPDAIIGNTMYLYDMERLRKTDTRLR